MPRTASVAAAAIGTVMLSSTPRGHDSAMAAMKTALMATPNDGFPKYQAMAHAAAPPKIRNARKPPQLFEPFQGKRAIGLARPISVAVPSPNARMAQATAASSMCQLKMTISRKMDSG